MKEETCGPHPTHSRWETSEGRTRTVMLSVDMKGGCGGQMRDVGLCTVDHQPYTAAMLSTTTQETSSMLWKRFDWNAGSFYAYQGKDVFFWIFIVSYNYGRVLCGDDFVTGLIFW